MQSCNEQFPHSPDMVPKGRLGLSLCAAPVTGSTSDRGNVYGGIMVDIEAKGSSPLSVGNYIQFGKSHESDFHGITRFGSKICHRSVTCVTCDTRVAVCDTGGLYLEQKMRRKLSSHFAQALLYITNG